MKHLLVRSALALSLSSILLSGAAYSATESDTFEVRVEVASVCEITANDVDFGTYSPLSAVALTSAISTIDVTCALATPFNVGIDAGTNGTSVSDRKMIRDSGTETIDYTLGCLINTPPAGAVLTNCATNWGNTVGTDTFLGVGLGITALPIIISGTIPINQDVPVGIYRDNPVTATVTF